MDECGASTHETLVEIDLSMMSELGFGLELELALELLVMSEALSAKE